MKKFWGYELQRLLSLSEASDVSGKSPPNDQLEATGLITDFTLRFDDVLDLNKLETSLERLLQRDEWRQLGTRLRKENGERTSKGINPTNYYPRPSMMFSETRCDACIEGHPFASQLPKARSAPSVSGPMSTELRDALRHPEYPATIDQWLADTNTPCIAVQVMVFHNSTLLTISYPHILMDAKQFSKLLRAWTAAICSNDDIQLDLELPIPLSALPPLVEPHILTNKLLSPFSTSLFNLLTTLSNLVHPASSTRTIIIPCSLAHRLRLRARRDLDSQHQYFSIEKPPFISDNDLVLAFMSQLTLSAGGTAPTRPVTLVNHSNAVEVPAYSFFPSVETLVAQPLGVTAKSIRESLTEQRKPGQVEAMKRLREGREGRIVFGEGWDLVEVGCENLHKGKFFDLDFSAAIAGQKVKEEEEVPRERGRPTGVYVNGRVLQRNAGSFLGRDSEGNWWISWTLREDVWPIIEKKLEAMSRDRIA